MRQTAFSKVKMIFLSACVLFVAPFALVLGFFGLYGLTRLAMTRNIQDTREAMETVSESAAFGWFSHCLHSAIAAIVGYRLARKEGMWAVPTIWGAVPLAMSVHMGIHMASGISLRTLHTQFRYIRLPFLMLVSTFVGFHSRKIYSTSRELENNKRLS